MTLLNLEHFAPTMLYTVCKTAAALDGPSRPELEEWLSPFSYGLIGDPQPARRTIDDLLRAAQLLGLLSLNDERYRNAADVSSLETFKRDVLAGVLTEKANAGLPATTTAAEELTWALTWLMSVDCTQGPLSFDRNVERLQAWVTPKPVRNANRWVDLVAWTTFLGFGWILDGGLIPDPTAVIATVLDEVIAPGTRMRCDEFINTLSRRLPVLDGGPYRARLDAQRPTSEGRELLSEPLSLALHRFVKQGEIKLDQMADGEARVAKVGGDVTATFHYVSRVAC